MRVNISLNNKLLKVVNSYCETMGYNRSELISELLRNKVIGDVKTTDELVEETVLKSSCKHGYMFGLCKFGCIE